MDDQEEVVVEREDQPLAQPTGARGCHALEQIDRRVEALECRDAGDADLLDRVPDDVAIQCLEVVDDVGVLRHASTVLSPS